MLLAVALGGGYGGGGGGGQSNSWRKQDVNHTLFQQISFD